MDQLRDICKKASMDILCIDETKIDSSFPDSQFYIDSYQFAPFRRDRNINGGGKIVYIKNGIIAKRISNLEGISTEIICIDITISKKKWCVFFVYRPPQNNNKSSFFNEISNILNQATNKYDNIVVKGDLNIDTPNSLTKDMNNYLSDLCDTFSLKNIIKGKTCFKTLEGTSIDVLLTNRPRSFRKTSILETGLNDYHKMILSVFRSYFAKIPPKSIEYRNYKKFSLENFLYDLDQELLKGEIYKSSNSIEMYSSFTKVYRKVLDKHAPLKVKKIRGNQALFMIKELSKVIMHKSKLKNKYQKWPSRENFLALQKSKNYCNNLSKSTKRKYFEKVTKKGFVNNRAFWNTVKLFLTNKGFLTNDNIVIKNNDEIITNKNEIVELFNSHYVNIVEKTSGFPPETEGNPEVQENDAATVKSIIDKYQNHSSILNIKNNIKTDKTFDIPHATTEQINKIIKNLNPKKATGPDKIPPKI